MTPANAWAIRVHPLKGCREPMPGNGISPLRVPRAGHRRLVKPGFDGTRSNNLHECAEPLCMIHILYSYIFILMEEWPSAHLLICSVKELCYICVSRTPNWLIAAVREDFCCSAMESLDRPRRKRFRINPRNGTEALPSTATHCYLKTVQKYHVGLNLSLPILPQSFIAWEVRESDDDPPVDHQYCNAGARSAPPRQRGATATGRDDMVSWEGEGVKLLASTW